MLYFPASTTIHTIILRQAAWPSNKKIQFNKIPRNLDRSQNWNDHMLKNKFLLISNRLRRMYRSDWDLNPQILKRIYTSGLERIMLYATEV